MNKECRFGYVNGHRKWSNANTKKFWAAYKQTKITWKTSAIKPVWLVSHKIIGIFWENKFEIIPLLQIAKEITDLLEMMYLTLTVQNYLIQLRGKKQLC